MLLWRVQTGWASLSIRYKPCPIDFCRCRQYRHSQCANFFIECAVELLLEYLGSPSGETPSPGEDIVLEASVCVCMLWLLIGHRGGGRGLLFIFRSSHECLVTSTWSWPLCSRRLGCMCRSSRFVTKSWFAAI
jgi:hypothetical protein